ncbi:MAG: hypothetical protein JRH16_12140 [Deltaproteobacteria bacterium]|nr:hypothetical protein [Deltaproteobacteria bacterium]MBW2361776.1 hypothetical protein [Deltaproteobacteria bacterium]
MRRAVEEDRILLTRDGKLADEWRISGLIRLRANEPLAQLAELAGLYGLAAGARPFSRCSLCNVELVRVERAEARGRVPPRVLTTCDHFWHCPACDRCYWHGSHVDRMREALEATLGRSLRDDVTP